MKPSMAYVLRSSIYILSVIGMVACSPETPANNSPSTDAQLIRLISLYGSAVEDTLENLPEIAKMLAAGAQSPLRAADAYLAEASPEDKDAYLLRLDNILKARKFLLEECSGLPNGVYQAAADDPELKEIADQALINAGMKPKGMTTYEVMSQMTSGQDAAMLTALARAIGEKNAETKEKLKIKFRELVKQNQKEAAN